MGYDSYADCSQLAEIGRSWQKLAEVASRTIHEKQATSCKLSVLKKKEALCSRYTWKLQKSARESDFIDLVGMLGGLTGLQHFKPIAHSMLTVYCNFTKYSNKSSKFG